MVNYIHNYSQHIFVLDKYFINCKIIKNHYSISINAYQYINYYLNKILIELKLIITLQKYITSFNFMINH
jgi:hypothetical protein